MIHKKPTIIRHTHNYEPKHEIKITSMPSAPATKNTLENMYVPEVVSMNSPQWIENFDSIPMLHSLFQRHYYSKSDGYSVDGNQCIVPGNGDGGIISAAAMSTDENGNMDYSFAHIMNTENAGLRYVHCCESGTKIDLGPVDHTCFIGNCNRAEGLYIPLHNTKAMADGAKLLYEIVDSVKTVKDDQYIDSPENVNTECTNEDHKCNGHCINCDGICINRDK